MSDSLSQGSVSERRRIKLFGRWQLGESIHARFIFPAASPEWGAPFYTAPSCQVALKKLQLEKLLTALRAGRTEADAVSAFKSVKCSHAHPTPAATSAEAHNLPKRSRAAPNLCLCSCRSFGPPAKSTCKSAASSENSACRPAFLYRARVSTRLFGHLATQGPSDHRQRPKAPLSQAKWPGFL